ncbi:MAG: TusE/DsrC/DsvC family sulfur relay protein [Myxococcales bacterium]|nr:TusE/DsrC/DsvC family sulfur relay protein [Myxococcales bacterium]
MNSTQPDMAAVFARLDAISTQLEFLVERQRKQQELLETFTPILREAIGVATERFADAEKKGWFDFGRELFGVTERIVEGFSPKDVRQLGDAVVAILETVRAMTQPEVLQIANETATVLQKGDDVEPIGLMGMVRATRDENVQKGMALMMDVMRQVGRAAHAVSVAKERSPTAQRRAKLAETLGPKRSRGVLGVERTIVASAAKGVPAAIAPKDKPAVTATSGPACAVPSNKPAVTAAVIDGVAFTADGHLVDPAQWSLELATKLAAAQGVAMTDAHWAVVRFARADFEATGVAPNIRRITQGASVQTKDLYALFPKAPARTIAKIAGIPKPAGCL